MQFFFLIMVLLASLVAESAPLSLSYQGRIIKSDGLPLEYASVSFEFRITNPNGSCVIYREQKNGNDMSNSKGLFDTPIGLGTKLFPTDPNFTIHNAFANSGTLQCEGGGTFTPSIDDERKLRVQFHDGAGWKLISPDNIIRSVPYAAHASHAFSAETLGSHGVNDFVLKSGIPVCSSGYVLTSSSSGTLTCVADTGGAAGTVSTILGTSPIVATDNGSGSYTISASVGTGSGQLAAGNDSRIVNSLQTGASASGDLSGTYPGPTVSRIAGVTLTISSPTSGQFLKHNGSAWINSGISASDVSGMSSYLAQSSFISSMTPAASCTSSQTPYWNSVASVFACQNITLPTSTSDNFWSGDGTNVYRNTGKVGVGTNSPDVTFTVQSTTPSTSTHPNRAGFIVKSEGTDVGGRIAMRTASTSENPILTGYRSQGTLVAPTAITTSQHLLNITGMGYDGAAWKEGASILFSPGENWDNTKTGTNIIFKTVTNTTNTATEKVRITHNGRLGIGPTNPVALVDAEVTGTGAILSGRFASNPSGTGPSNFNSLVLDNTYGAANFKNEIKFRSATSDKWSLGTDPAGAGEQIFYIWDAVASQRRLNIDASGNVGMGVDVPTQKLDVAGKVKATEFCIGTTCLSAWPSGGGSGTVTNIATGTGLTGGPITATGTISIANGGVDTTQLADGAVTQAKLETVSGLSAGAYGSATAIPSITVDTKGRVTAISTTTVTTLPSASAVSGKFLKSNGTTWSGQNILFSDIKNSAGTSAFSVASCAANQTVNWSSLTDTFGCQNIGSLDATTITTGTIDAARLPASVSDGLWTSTSGNVSRATGSVGIGTSSPGAALHVSAGDILLDNGRSLKMKRNSGGLSIDVLSFASGTDNLQLKLGTTSSAAGLEFLNSSNTAIATLTGAGNLGIGVASPAAKLDVAGEVKFGNTSSTCNTANEGQQRYNSTSKIMEFCNGSAWTAFGGSSEASGTLCGMRNWQTSSNGGSSGYGATNAPCKGVVLTGNASTTSNCPTGYTGRSLLSGSSYDSGSNSLTSYYILTCYKN